MSSVTNQGLASSRRLEDYNKIKKEWPILEPLDRVSDLTFILKLTEKEKDRAILNGSMAKREIRRIFDKELPKEEEVAFKAILKKDALLQKWESGEI